MSKNIFFLIIFSMSAAVAQETMRAPLESYTTKQNPYKTSWGLGLYSRGVSDSVEKSVATGLGATGTLEFSPERWLKTTITPGFVVESGSLASLYDANVPRNQIFLDQAVVQATPISQVRLAAGAINQRFLESPLLIDAQSFPAAFESLSDHTDNTKWSLTAQQAIPTSISLSTMTSDKEPLPTFFTFSARGEWAPNPELNFVARASRFAFSNLPTQVAYKSSLNGNKCVTGDVPQNMRFNCGFAGYTAGLQANSSVYKDYLVSVGGDYILNPEAPSGQNQGYLTFGQVRFALNPAWQMTTRGEFFFNESDASPSFYNAVAFGHSNRQGYAADFKFENRVQHFGIRARYVDARLVEENDNQTDTSIFYLGLELSGVEI